MTRKQATEFKALLANYDAGRYSIDKQYSAVQIVELVRKLVMPK